MEKELVMGTMQGGPGQDLHCHPWLGSWGGEGSCGLS